MQELPVVSKWVYLMVSMKSEYNMRPKYGLSEIEVADP